jgi:hypothetical protein
MPMQETHDTKAPWSLAVLLTGLTAKLRLCTTATGACGAPVLNQSRLPVQ